MRQSLRVACFAVCVGASLGACQKAPSEHEPRPSFAPTKLAGADARAKALGQPPTSAPGAAGSVSWTTVTPLKGPYAGAADACKDVGRADCRVDILDTKAWPKAEPPATEFALWNVSFDGAKRQSELFAVKTAAGWFAGPIDTSDFAAKTISGVHHATRAQGILRFDYRSVTRTDASSSTTTEYSVFCGAGKAGWGCTGPAQRSASTQVSIDAKGVVTMSGDHAGTFPLAF